MDSTHPYTTSNGRQRNRKEDQMSQQSYSLNCHVMKTSSQVSEVLLEKAVSDPFCATTTEKQKDIA